MLVGYFTDPIKPDIFYQEFVGMQTCRAAEFLPQTTC